jgi:hypothetical protein
MNVYYTFMVARLYIIYLLSVHVVLKCNGSVTVNQFQTAFFCKLTDDFDRP